MAGHEIDEDRRTARLLELKKAVDAAVLIGADKFPKPQLCPYCTSRYSTLSGMDRHVFTKHLSSVGGSTEEKKDEL